MTATALCQHLGIHRRTLSRWVLDPELDFPKPAVINGRWYFTPRPVDDFMERRRAVMEHEAKKLAEAQAAKQAEDKPAAEAQPEKIKAQSKKRAHAK